MSFACAACKSASRRSFLTACVALVMGATALSQVGISTPSARIAAQQQAFAAAQGPVAKLVCVYRIGQLMRLLPVAAQQGVWAKLSATPGLDPLVQAEITSREAAVALRGGNAEEASADWKELGEVEAWRVIGPFDNSSAGAIATAEGPEKGIDLKAKYQGKQRQVGWRVIPYSATLGSLNLGAFLSPSQSASAYAVSWVHSKKARPVALRLRDDGSTRIWVNTKLVFTEQGSHPSFGFDQHAVGAQLEAGWNEILAKVGDGETGGWSFALRVTTPEGKPLALEASDAPHGAKPLAVSQQPLASSQHAAAVSVRDLTEMAKAGDTTPQGKLDYAWVLAQKQNFNTGDHSDTSAFLDAIAAAASIGAGPSAAAPRDPLMLAPGRGPQSPSPALRPAYAQAVIDFEAHDSDISRRYQYLQQLLHEPNLSAAVRGQAHLDAGYIELSRGSYWPARSDFWAALTEGTGTQDQGRGELAATDEGGIAPSEAIQKAPLAAAGMLQIYADVGLRPQALAWADALKAAGEMDVAAVAEPVGVTLRRTGPLQVALQWLEAAQKDDAANLHNGLELADLLQHNGKNEEALATVERLSTLVGKQPHLLDLEARALAGLGRAPAALARSREAVELAPDSAEFRIEQGEIERHFGHHEAAIANWQAALQLNPQDASLRDRLQLARGGEAAEEASFERPYMQDLTKAIAAYKALPTAERQTLEGGPVVVLADTNVANIFPSGNTGRYVQQIFRVNNDSGANALSVYPVTYDPEAEDVHFLSAHVVHADGSTADAPQAGDQPISQSVGYETFYNVRNKFVVMPSLRAGDFVEIAYRVLPTTLESLYGDYYGAVDTFGSSSPTLFQQYVVISPANKPLYSHAVRFDGEHSTTTKDGQTVYRWSARNLAAEINEPLATPDIERQSYVAVSEFQTWDQFAAWYRHLIRNTFVMDSQIEQTVAQLIAGKTTEAEKVDAIYRWVIQNTHYVALEFGIHGYRPYPVTQVFHRRFGDCKDKASLLIAMLHAAGIQAEFVLVRIRDLGLVDPTIPSVADFDHAIVYVPNMNLYLDGTAEYNGTRDLPAGDQRAFVLRIPIQTDLGSDPAPGTATAKVAPVVTPEQAPAADVTARTLVGQLDAQGNLHFEINLDLNGGDAPMYRQAMEIPDRQAGAMQAMLHNRLPGISVTSATVTDERDWDKPLRIQFRGVIPSFATVNGNTLLLPRQIIPRSWLPRLAALSSRTSELLAGPPQILIEQMHLALPPGFQVQTLPAASNLTQDFADFQAAASVNGNTLTMLSRIEIKRSLIAPAEYATYRNFWAQVDGALGRSITLTPGGKE